MFVRRFSKRSGLCGLVGGIAVGLAIFAVGSAPSLAYLREMVWIFPATAVATVAFMTLGSLVFSASERERAEVNAFMDRIGGAGAAE